jgi:hypothetical protein
MNVLRITAFISAACLTAYLGYKFVTADPPGYCRAQDRYIGDEEFLKATIAITNRNMEEPTRYPDGKIVKNKEVAPMYKNRDFDPKNPNCCVVLRSRTHSDFNRVFGLQEIEVVLNSRTSTESVMAGDHKQRFRWDVCGNLWDSDIGLPNTAYRVISTKNIGE